MKRATLLLDDALYRQAKALGRKEGKTLKEVVNDLLRLALNTLIGRTEATKTDHFKMPLHKGNGPRLLVDVSSRESYYDILEKEHDDLFRH